MTLLQQSVPLRCINWNPKSNSFFLDRGDEPARHRFTFPRIHPTGIVSLSAKQMNVILEPNKPPPVRIPANTMLIEFPNVRTDQFDSKLTNLSFRTVAHRSSLIILSDGS
jgi:hypothetical protein